MRKSAMCLLLIVLAPMLFSQNKPIIAVLDFKTDGISDKEMRSIIEMLSSGLFNTGRYTVIDVTQRELLLKEQEFSTSDCSDESCQLKVGKMLSAELIVVGSVGKVGSRYLFSTKMLETETARTRSFTDGVYVSLDAMVDDLPNSARKLAGVAVAAAGPSAAKVTWGTVTLVGGVACLGAGGWFLYDSLFNGPVAVSAAQAAYTAASTAEMSAKKQALEDTIAWVKTEMYIGAGVCAAGLVLSTVSTIIFTLPEGAPKVAVNLGYREKATTLSFHVAY